MTRVLVTGFEPFDGSRSTPSQQLVDALDGGVAKALLPVSLCARRQTSCARAIREAEPDVVICFGQADGRAGISVERFAHNLDDAAAVDNDAATRLRHRDRPGRAARLRVDAARRRARRRAARAGHPRRRLARRGRLSSATTSSTC